MGNVRLARAAVEVLTRAPGKVRDARTAVEVLTKAPGKVRDVRTAVEVLTQAPGRTRLARAAVEVLVPSSDGQFRWGPSLAIVPVLVAHSFNVANTSVIPAGEVGPAPVEYNGDWSINSNQLLAPGSGEAVIGWEVGRTAYVMEFTISAPSVDPGPCVRLQDAANYILCQMNFTGTSAIYQRVGGGYSALMGAVSVPWATGDAIRVVNSPTRVECYRNGALVMAVNTGVFASQTKVGFRTNGGANRFDGLLVTGDPS